MSAAGVSRDEARVLGVEGVRIADMRSFVMLARVGHFGRTAKALGTSQPVISSRIASIEQQLGFKLVDRTRRGFALTPEGEMVLAAFRRILSDLSDLDDALRDADPSAPEIVRIGAIDSAIASWLPALVDRLHHALPSLRIELTIQGTQELIAGLEDQSLDMIFALSPAVGEGIQTWSACHYQMGWVAAPGLVRAERSHSAQDLAGLPIITFARGTPPFRLIAGYFQDENVLAAQLISCNSLFAMINLAAIGYGIAAVPVVTVERELASGALQRVNTERPFATMPLVASWRADRNPRLMERIGVETRRHITAYCAGTRAVLP